MAKTHSSVRSFPQVYTVLRDLASRQMGGDAGRRTLQPTALVHEAYLRLAGRSEGRTLGRTECYRLAASAMRTILIDHARRRRADKRSGSGRRIALDAVLEAYEERALDLVALDEALTRLAIRQPRQATVVELRFFSGMSWEEIASVLGIALRTAHRDWQEARRVLFADLSGSSSVHQRVA